MKADQERNSHVFVPEQQTALESLKQDMANAGTSANFDKTAPMKIVVDASPVGLGDVLLQKQKDSGHQCTTQTAV